MRVSSITTRFDARSDLSALEAAERVKIAAAMSRGELEMLTDANLKAREAVSNVFVVSFFV